MACFFVLFLLALAAPLFTSGGDGRRILGELSQIVSGGATYRIRGRGRVISLGRHLRHSGSGERGCRLYNSLFGTCLRCRTSSTLCCVGKGVGLLPLLGRPRLGGRVIVGHTRIVKIVKVCGRTLRRLRQMSPLRLRQRALTCCCQACQTCCN